MFDNTIKDVLNERLDQLEQHFDAHVIFYFGEIHPYYEKPFRDFIEKRKTHGADSNRFAIFLNTPGGSANYF